MPESRVLASDHPETLKQAVSVLRRGGLIVLPTDTVYGLAADAWNGEAVSKLYSVKDRSAQKAIPVLLPGASAIETVGERPRKGVLALAARFWPGPLTMVIERRRSLPKEISDKPTVGVRAPDHEFTLSLLRQFGPLATTSANLSGGPSAVTLDQITHSIRETADLIIDGGRAAGGMPSTVVDLTVDPPEVRRNGPISLEAVLAVWEGYRG